MAPRTSLVATERDDVTATTAGGWRLPCQRRWLDSGTALGRSNPARLDVAGWKMPEMW